LGLFVEKWQVSSFDSYRVSRVSRARVRVSLRIRVRFTFGDRVRIGLPNVE